MQVIVYCELMPLQLDYNFSVACILIKMLNYYCYACISINSFYILPLRSILCFKIKSCTHSTNRELLVVSEKRNLNNLDQFPGVTNVSHKDFLHAPCLRVPRLWLSQRNSVFVWLVRGKTCSSYVAYLCFHFVKQNTHTGFASGDIKICLFFSG